MKSEEIRTRFLSFFKKRGHVIIPSASLVPKNDPSVLFTTAGMQPLVPYLLGEKHPAGNCIVDVQKCVRTQDIEEVGDKTHDTFFEMLGNWSLGDPKDPDGIGAGYFKKEAIEWSYEFLTSEEEGLGLDPNRLYITCFEGDKDAPKDTESAGIWESLGIPKERIYFFGKESNWWSPGDNGPCGPDTEMFYDISPLGSPIQTKEDFKKADSAQRVVEIWNDVFMEYEKRDGKVVGKLKQKNVDTGAGLERLAMVMQKKDNIFDTDLFVDLISAITKLSSVRDVRAERIVADHIRTAVFMIGDGVIPSNTDRGYILRRLIRRAVRYTDTLQIKKDSLATLADVVIKKYEAVYPNVAQKSSEIKKEINEEEARFRQTLKNGLKELEKFSEKEISGKDAFILFSTYGFPIEMTIEIGNEKNIAVDVLGFADEMKKHQELSRQGAEQKFKGGLAGHSDKEVHYHTATHLLHQALRTVLGNHVFQKGSNITSERLRFDFSHPKKMTEEEKKQVENIVNEKIKEALPVSWEEMSIEEAKQKGAIGLFDDQYGERVKVYQVGNEDTGIFSLEFCGGPHVKNTSELKRVFKIKKEEAVSAGTRRIKAILE
ncbi:MAG: alanine--tRNA ligase [bacterium]|nr:alanine--tRNA ligase [bacterium]